ncbi:MAG: DnaJ domain-containing protein [bacterium]
MSASVADLGAWEDIACRTDADVTAAPIDSRAAFVLTRVDGLTSIADLCAMSGFGQRETIKLLTELLEHRLITVQRAEGERRPIRLPARRQETRELPRATRPTVPDFTGVDPADVAILRRHGALGRVPGRPFADPGQDRYGGHVFDRRRLLERAALTLEQKKETLFLAEHQDALDHFEYLGVEPTDDRKALKKAYFAFSKRFHPDTVFRRDVGAFRPLIEQIFKRGTEIYEALTRDEALREAYARAVTARDRAFRARLEDERRAADETRRQKQLAESAERKDALRARLEQNTRTRRETGLANPVAERLDRAERYYKEGMAHYKAESFIAAANALRLAVSFDPRNEQYKAAFEKVDERARQVRAEQQWKAGYMQESVGRVREAIALYLEACDQSPRHDYCAHVAGLLLEHGIDLHKAAELAGRAVEAQPQEVDYLLLLGRIYAQANLPKKAQSVLEAALKLDPKNDETKQALRAIKRM